MIYSDPINLLLAIIPTIMAIVLYLLVVVATYRNSEKLISFFKDYIHTSEHADLLAKILTGILIVLIFILMSWTFVLVVGIISSPFNSVLSARIEKRLRPTSKIQDRSLFQSILFSLKNEFKKVLVILCLTFLAITLNFLPLLYPVSLFLTSLLIASQFLDYNWSRHEMPFGKCFKEVTSHWAIYGISGFGFLLLVSIPIINALVPALATSYFTVLWVELKGESL
jgi:uncharacterized protein involved in cysteine biosynthesis